MFPTLLSRGAALLICLASGSALATDFSYSGYGTVGYVRSDQDYNYQRSINSSGTFRRDTVFGAQVDAQFSSQWSATVQAKVAAADAKERGWEGSLAWAMISYRPTNDWLLRAGKIRAPGYMNSENMDVGVTFDMARLPIEMYSTTPAMDFFGFSASKNWALDIGELNLEGFTGERRSHWRYNYRQGIPGLVDSGAYYMPIDIKGNSLAMTLRREEDTYRVGYHFGTFTRADGQYIPATFPLVAPFPGISYYQVDNRIPGPGVENLKTLGMSVFYLGADVGLPNDFRVIGEYARRHITLIDYGPNTSSIALALSKRIGAWTPYVSYASIRSGSVQTDWMKKLNKAQVPAWIPQSEQLNASQKIAADTVTAYDQSTIAIGASYRLSPTSKLKGEWSRVRVGDVSYFVDSPAGSVISQQSINVLSLSYNFVF